MRVPFLDLTRQNSPISEQLGQAFAEALETSGFILGSPVTDFETQFSNYLGVSSVIGVANGTDAIELAVRALDLEPGSEIIVPSNSFIASALGVTRAGFTPVFCDNDEDFLIDLNSAERMLSSKTRAIIIVSLYGQLPNMDAVANFAQAHNLYVIEDFAQAQGAKYRGKLAGSFGHISATSFYPGKNLGALGDAGCVVTDDSRLAERVRQLRNYGSEVKYHHPVIGFNSRLDSLQARFLSLKLDKLDEWNAERREISGKYLTGLSGIRDLILPRVLRNREHVWHIFAVRTKKRDELQAYLEAKGIQTIIHYPVCIPDQGAYVGSRTDEYSRKAFYYGQELLSLPMFPGITQEEQDYVISITREFFANG